MSVDACPRPEARPRAAPKRDGRADGPKVAILGGGVAGLSAAHEAMERGFSVEVFERKAIAGGKARSIPAPQRPGELGLALPGEHGFRFFPAFYRHLPDTMGRIPVDGAGRTALDNLVYLSHGVLETADRRPIVMPARLPTSLADLELWARSAAHPPVSLFGSESQLSAPEAARFARALATLLTSCEEHRNHELEHRSWWDFVGAEGRSGTYQTLCGDVGRLLVACRGDKLSAKTGGKIGLQLLLGATHPGPGFDRVLNGPTNDAWIDPWVDHLRRSGVEYTLGAQVVALECDGASITGALVERQGRVEKVVADHYIAAFPAEVMRRLTSPEMLAAAPSLGGLEKLETAWMTGIQFFVRESLSDIAEHRAYAGSPWALTSIAQKKFWGDFDLSKRGDGTVRDILSVDISEWNRPGVLFDKNAVACTAEEIKAEVLAQIGLHLAPHQAARLASDRLAGWTLDPGISFPEPGQATNDEPLLLNTVGSWQHRPEAITEIPNLFLAADYVRTHTDLATMEGANEAARRAVNGLIAASGHPARPCPVWPLDEPAFLRPAKRLDRVAYQLGLPNLFDPEVRR